MTVSDDVLLYMLDKDPQRLYDEIAGADVSAVAVALTYGKDLPQGRQWGSRDQRRAWIESERAKHVRRTVLQAALQAIPDEATLMRLYRAIRKRRGYGPVIKRLIREWHELHHTAKMELV